MTIEQLGKANEIYKELKETREFLKAFDSPSCNSIRANRFDEGRELTEYLLLEKDDNLSNLIRGYVSNQITELEKQLEEL